MAVALAERRRLGCRCRRRAERRDSLQESGAPVCHLGNSPAGAAGGGRRRRRPDQHRGALGRRGGRERRRAAGHPRRRHSPRERNRHRTGRRRRGAVLPPRPRHRRVDRHRGAARLPALDPDRHPARGRPHPAARVHPRPRRDQRGGDGRDQRPPAADHDGRDQRRHRDPRGRDDPPERPAVPAARPAQRRGRHPPRRHPGRRPPAGGAAAQRRGPAGRAQHLHARRVQGHRRALQQPRHQPVGRLHPGVQDPEVDVPARVRGKGVGPHQRGDPIGREQLPREPVRVHARRALRRPQLLRRPKPAGAPPRPGPVRRHPRRPHRPRPHVLLHELRAAGHAAVDHQDLLGARRGGPGRGLLGLGRHLRSADHRSGHRLVPAVPRQPDPGGSARPHRQRIPLERADADGRRALPEPDLGRAAGQGRAPVQRARRSPAGRGRPSLPAGQHLRRRRDPAVRHRGPAGVPGARIRPHPRHHDPQRRGELHQGHRPEQAERAPLRLHVGGRRAAQPERGGRLRRPGRPARGEPESPRRRVPADLDGGAVQHHGRPHDVRVAQQRALRDLRQLPHRPGQPPLQVRRLPVPPAVPPRQRRHRARGLRLHRAVERQRDGRLPARVPDLGPGRHRRRRPGLAHHVAAPLRPGRLAGARQPDHQLRAALRVQRPHEGRRQPPVVDRPVGAGRALRRRERRRRQHLARGRGADAADADSLGDVGRGRLGT